MINLVLAALSGYIAMYVMNYHNAPWKAVFVYWVILFGKYLLTAKNGE